MSYERWFNSHGEKHAKIVTKLKEKNLSVDEIIEYFEFENMCQNESDFCQLYKTKTKCHELEYLNCYLCACPNFRFDDAGLGEYGNYKILSRCNINNGSEFRHENSIHQDCSKCSVPHHKEYVKKHFSYDWFEIMKEVKS